MKLSIRFAALALLVTGALFAQALPAPAAPDPGLLGRWAASAEYTDGAGVKHTERSTVELRMEDGKLVGNRVGGNGRPSPVFKVIVDGTKANFYEYLVPDGGEHLRWKVELKDGTLVGSFSAQHDNPQKWIYDRVMPMTWTKVEVPAAK